MEDYEEIVLKKAQYDALIKKTKTGQRRGKSEIENIRKSKVILIKEYFWDASGYESNEPQYIYEGQDHWVFQAISLKERLGRCQGNSDKKNAWLWFISLLLLASSITLYFKW